MLINKLILHNLSKGLPPPPVRRVDVLAVGLIVVVIIVVISVVVVIVVDVAADSVDDIEGRVGRDEEEGGEVERSGDPGTSFLSSHRWGGNFKNSTWINLGQNQIPLQGWARAWSPGCENF